LSPGFQSSPSGNRLIHGRRLVFSTSAISSPTGAPINPGTATARMRSTAHRTHSGTQNRPTPDRHGLREPFLKSRASARRNGATLPHVEVGEPASHAGIPPRPQPVATFTNRFPPFSIFSRGLLTGENKGKIARLFEAIQYQTPPVSGDRRHRCTRPPGPAGTFP